jgi:hypothetical protein
MLLYPGLTLLDLIGPQTVFSWFANIHLVWKTTDLIDLDVFFRAEMREQPALRPGRLKPRA